MASAASAPVSKEQTFLEKFFLSVSQFAFDKAKDLADKEKEAYKTFIGSTWFQFLCCLAPFTQTEKSYASLSFLVKRGFLGSRDSGTKGSYEALRTELKKIEDSGKQLAGGGTALSLEKLLSHLSGQLIHFVNARIDAMDFYERLHSLSVQKEVNYSGLLMQTKDLIDVHQNNFHHPILSSLKNSYTLEWETVRYLLQAQIDMAYWKFLPSLLCLHNAHVKLASWGAMLQHKEASSFSFLGMSSRHTANAYLYDWLSNYEAALVSKFTLYFHEILSKQTVPSEMKILTAKTSFDYYQKIVSFQRKTDAYSVSIVFDIHGLPAVYKGHGYHHPSKVTEQPMGLDSYPPIFYYPTTEKPTSHWASVVRILTDHKLSELNSMDKVVCFYDRHVQNTYFMMIIERHMTLVVIFDCKRSEKDSYVCNFVMEMATSLRGTKILNSLKPGAK